MIRRRTALACFVLISQPAETNASPLEGTSKENIAASALLSVVDQDLDALISQNDPTSWERLQRKLTPLPHRNPLLRDFELIISGRRKPIFYFVRLFKTPDDDHFIYITIMATFRAGKEGMISACLTGIDAGKQTPDPWLTAPPAPMGFTLSDNYIAQLKLYTAKRLGSEVRFRSNGSTLYQLFFSTMRGRCLDTLTAKLRSAILEGAM